MISLSLLRFQEDEQRRFLEDVDSPMECLDDSKLNGIIQLSIRIFMDISPTFRLESSLTQSCASTFLSKGRRRG
jgi:hypothetical protein